MANKALKIVNGVPRMVPVGIEVKEEGVTILSEATAIDFVGSVVTATDQGASVAQVDVTGGSTTSGIYDETLTAAIDYVVDDIITLPNSGVYDSVDLKVFLDGSFWEPGIDYVYVGVAPTRTQIQLKRLVNTGDKLRFRAEGLVASIYDEVNVVPNGGYAAGSTITLPSSKTYKDADLKVYLDGTFLEPLIDYNYVGPQDGNRTQIQLVIELFEGERLRFRIEE